MPRVPGWPEINPGRFRNAITLLNPVTSTDASGVVTSFASSVPPQMAYMAIEYARGSEAIKAGQDVTLTQLELCGWFDAAWTAGKRVQVPNGTQYIIQNVNNVRMMNVYMILYCQDIGATT